jgi:hypothetical protein
VHSQRRPDREQVAQLDSAIKHSERGLTQLLGEHRELAASLPTERRAPQPTSRDRLELTLIGEQMTRLYRRQVALERLRPSEMILNTLGQRPSDPFKAQEWNAAVDLIHSYRQRHGVSSPSGHALGPKTGDAGRRRERQIAQQRLMRIQQRLAKDRVRKAERALRLFR